MLSSIAEDGNGSDLSPRSKDEFNLVELIDRILDKGVVINGDITLSIAGTDFLSLKINLVIASLETAKRYGIQLPWEKWQNEAQGSAVQNFETPQESEQQYSDNGFPNYQDQQASSSYFPIHTNELNRTKSEPRIQTKRGKRRASQRK